MQFSAIQRSTVPHSREGTVENRIVRSSAVQYSTIEFRTVTYKTIYVLSSNYIDYRIVYHTRVQ